MTSSSFESYGKRDDSKLLIRIVAEQSIPKWCHNFEQMENDITSIIQEEREERDFRKEEMEVNKAQNMVDPKTVFVDIHDDMDCAKDYVKLQDQPCKLNSNSIQRHAIIMLEDPWTG